jgi:hypothetical protein
VTQCQAPFFSIKIYPEIWCLAPLRFVKKFPSANMLERLATALEVEPHELFYMPSITKNALVRLQETVSANIEQIVADAIEKTLAESIKTNRLC